MDTAEFVERPLNGKKNELCMSLHRESVKYNTRATEGDEDEKS